MTTANQKKFKGEIERYLLKTSFHFDSKIKEVFVSLKTRTCLCQSNIIKHDGYQGYQKENHQGVNRGDNGH